ncbi:MAG: (2Fe-2S)-binding protein [Geoalkalibacter sp.]|jgi:xanthine dehydrogenase YagT iron-sulfur-binding subunit|uniref:(2Fe-2S)-binding protein n=1 Tax=Geoalkalibacter sp. TaxID=3041440 RepID=UPI002A966BAF|nr:(2Fe-2S)-binding protein [Thermodesulfobacteriota bacterium]
MCDKDKKDSCPHTAGINRRGFLTTVGIGAAAVAVSGRVNAPATAGAQEITSDDMVRITLNINGRKHRLLVEPRWTLLYVLRDRMGMTATKVGCERGECGACTVLIDDRPRYACMTLALEAENQRITTLEGLMKGEELGTTQQAFLDHDAYQCGYCTPGQIMSAEGLLRATANPTREQIAEALSGNLCRCGAYVHIFDAVETAAQKRKA